MIPLMYLLITLTVPMVELTIFARLITLLPVKPMMTKEQGPLLKCPKSLLAMAQVLTLGRAVKAVGLKWSGILIRLLFVQGIADPLPKKSAMRSNPRALVT